MAGRHELTDAHWARIEHLLPNDIRRGRPWNDHRRTLDGILWILRTGAPWRDLPKRYGKFTSVHDRFGRWRADGTLDRILAQLRDDLDAAGKIDWDLWCIDGSSVRATRAASGAKKRALKTSRRTMRSGARAAGSPRSSI